MDNNLAYINDFIDIETIINGKSYETSVYTGVTDFFYSHLSESDITGIVKIEPINVFEIKIGNLLKLNPSVWAVKFSEKNKLPMEMEQYEIVYKVIDIVIRYYSKNPNADTELPKLDIKIILEKDE